MKKALSDPPDIARANRDVPVQSTVNAPVSTAAAAPGTNGISPSFVDHAPHDGKDAASFSNASRPSDKEKPSSDHQVHDASLGQSLPVTSSQDAQQGADVGGDGQPPDGPPKSKRATVRGLAIAFWKTSLKIITHSWLNVLLVFVPLGIITAEIDGIHGGVVFAMNCIAVVPLAGLLAYATESVASEMGDALGALLNVTFGNAVELIIFIALTKNQIRIVQASLLGSILSNLLLILGMGFFLGGLRYREQIYNSTVTQMSACLLSLSVISLVLPTAFHASFSDSHLADAQSLKISRGTSVILLLVYGIYLLFQLKSHAYLYESTPQHIVDAESVPGPAAGWLDSSSSDESSSSSSDSEDSDSSRDTVRKRMKKVLRGRRRRKSSIVSVETNGGTATRSSSFATVSTAPKDDGLSQPSHPRDLLTGANASATGIDEDAIEDDGSSSGRRKKIRRHHRKSKKSKRHQRGRAGNENTDGEIPNEGGPSTQLRDRETGEPRRVDFAIQRTPVDNNGENTGGDPGSSGNQRAPFLRGISVKNLAPAVFVQRPEAEDRTANPSGPVPRVRYGIRRTNSLPDRLRGHQNLRPPGAMFPAQVPLAALTGGAGAETANKVADEEDEVHLSKVASVILLLVSTGLVALCAEFLVGSIEEVTATSSIGEIFIGLIILPVVGNAAEHVTAITVAMKNKMDLAIGVAVGSSIQIAIFVTPLVVILGWILDREMTLYFTLFETVCLFVSAFMVNFLVLDGRSNYLEGALLCAVYLIIAVVAFFYPDGEDASSWGQ